MEVQVPIAKIICLCAVVYGFIGLCWFICWSAPHRLHGVIAKCRVGLLCLSWASTSLGMHVINKALMSALRAPAIVSTVQMIIAVAIMLPIFGRQLFQVPGRALRCWM